MALRWYVVQAYSGYEKSVKLSLEERIARSRSDLQKCFGPAQQLTEDGETEHLGPVLVPTEEVVEMRAGQKHKSERRLFPGYVLILMDMYDDNGEPSPFKDEIWHLVKDVPKVMGFIGGTLERPAPISETEANAILLRIAEGSQTPRPKVLFEIGEVVRVTEGPFADFNGVVEEVNYEKNRLRVAVLIFGRSTPVELEFGHVEKE